MPCRLLILSITFVAPRLGLANAILFVLLGQLVSAAVMDATGLTGLASRPVTWARLAGLGLMAAGVLLAQRG
ncbi:DMT family transporter [Tabrizicola thermarum]|uniref:DMT family transporter n=1 Tax=Tabrizicola thermarum TaxID=2670345 RepID=UPI001EE4483E|nr:DMT family transporter [Tabrizicola thermarum]